MWMVDGLNVARAAHVDGERVRVRRRVVRRVSMVGWQEWFWLLIVGWMVSMEVDNDSKQIDVRESNIRTGLLEN
jgi:hypothetical protein